MNEEFLDKELNFQKNKIQMTNKEKEKRDSITSTSKKRRKKHKTERKKREKENNIKQHQGKARYNNAIKSDRDRAQ